MTGRAGRRRDWGERPVVLVAAALIAAIFIWRARTLSSRYFDEDEFEHLHVAWLVFKGHLPYRDFFEMHMPWFHFLLTPLFRLFDVERSFPAAVALIVWTRRLMWALSGAIVALTWAIGRRFFGARTGWTAAFLLAAAPMFLEKAAEIRPDLFSVLLWLGGLLALSVPSAAAAAASGLLLGAATMFSQKTLFVLPGLALVLFRRGARCWGAWMAAFAAPVALTFAYFAARGGLGAFLYYNLIFTAHFQRHLSPLFYMLRLMEQSPFLFLLGFVGFAAAARRARRRQASEGEFLAVAGLGSLLAGLFVIPVAQRQYFMIFLPLFALFGAETLVKLAGWLERAAAPGGAARDAWILAALLIGLGLQGYPALRDSLAGDNASSLAVLRYALEKTAPSDTVMEGTASALGAFRPHAYFFYVMHGDILPLLGHDALAALASDLDAGRVKPAFISYDIWLRALPPGFQDFFRRHYRPVGLQDVWKRAD